jgi:predicted metal-binding protein
MKVKIGIIICDRYQTCDGGKCFRSIRNREGAFKCYPKSEPLEIVAYTTCGGCPGENIEQVIMGIKKNGALAVHFATGVLAGYPPCPYLEVFQKLITERTGLFSIIGTHPMPSNYIEMHKKVNDWSEIHWAMLKQFQLIEQDEIIKYDSSLSSYEEILKKELIDD